MASSSRSGGWSESIGGPIGSVAGDGIECFHHVAKHGPLGAAGRQHLAAELFLIVGPLPGAHHHGLDLRIQVDRGDLVIGTVHVLVKQASDRDIPDMIS